MNKRNNKQKTEWNKKRTKTLNEAKEMNERMNKLMDKGSWERKK